MAAAGALLWRSSRPRDPGVDPAPVPPGAFRPTDVQWAGLTLARVAAEPFGAAIHTDGRVATIDRANAQVFSPVSGRILRLIAKQGAYVRAGAPLASLSGAEYAQAAGDVAAAGKQVVATEANAKRQRELYRDQGAALKDVQQSEADAAAARGALANARGRLEAMGVSPADIARLERAGPGRGEPFVLRAPVSGVVVQAGFGEGQSVASLSSGGNVPLFVIADLSKVWLVGGVRLADARYARLGAMVEARPLAGEGPTRRARIDYVSPVVDPATHRVTVRATVDNPDGLMRPDSFIDFAILPARAAPAVVVQAQAITYEGDRAHVWVAEPARRLLRVRAVRPGVSDASRVEILQGLSPGEVIVAEGAIFIDQAAKGE